MVVSGATLSPVLPHEPRSHSWPTPGQTLRKLGLLLFGPRLLVIPTSERSGGKARGSCHAEESLLAILQPLPLPQPPDRSSSAAALLDLGHPQGALSLCIARAPAAPAPH